MGKTSGKTAIWLRINSAFLYTARLITNHNPQIKWIKARVLNYLFHLNPHRFPQAKSPILLLFEQNFYPVSTTPTIKTTD